MERMERDRIAKRVYVIEYAGSRLEGRWQKRWIDTMKDCLRKRGLDIRQARRMVGVCEWECMGYSQGDEPHTLTRCHSYMKPVGGNCLWPSLLLKGIKGKMLLFFFPKLCFSLILIHFMA